MTLRLFVFGILSGLSPHQIGQVLLFIQGDFWVSIFKEIQIEHGRQLNQVRHDIPNLLPQVL